MRLRMPARTLLVASTGILGVRDTLHAQLGSFNPAPGPQGTFAIRNAHIVTVSGPESRAAPSSSLAERFRRWAQMRACPQVRK
jgi:hypothetical protein